MGDEAITTVKVTVRARPFNDREKKENAAQCLDFHCPTNQISYGKHLFAFDNVLDPDTTQDVAYSKIGKDLFDRFCKGFNCTMLAYGQTGSGKTFTMGTEETTKSMKSDSRGIIPRLVEDLFLWIESSDCPVAYSVSVSMLEIYDEKVNDLLAATKGKEGLPIREQDGQVLVPGLSKVDVKSFAATMEQLEHGCKLRSKGETAMNATSSRSHAIFTIMFEKAAVTEEDTKFSAKLHLVDLAGSERLKKTQAEGERMREGISINAGLLVLGNVISALSEANAASRHIPYRDSKITRLLQDSLGGNSYTVMIACVSPADSNGEETLSTLRYANRAKMIKNKPVVNMDPDQKIIKQLREQVAAQQRELSMFRAGIVPTSNGSMDPAMATELTRLKEQLAESQQRLSEAHSKTAQTLAQKMAISRQMMKLEEDREKLTAIFSNFPIDTLNGDNADNESATVDAANILKQLSDVFYGSGRDDDLHQRTMSPCPQADITDSCELLDENGEIDITYESNFVDRQNQFDKDYADLMEQLRSKEDAMKHSSQDQATYDKLVAEYQQKVVELNRKIEELTAEKERQNAEIKKTSTCGKLAEERRRKLQEVEKQLAVYKKQMNEFKRMEKQKRDNEELLKKTRNEILELKQTRVRMMKQSRDDAEKYRQWKMKADKQLAQMKSKERKREAEIQRDTRMKQQQMHVLQQKLDESKRVCKRLEQQRGRAGQLPEEKTDGKTLKTIKSFLVEELALITSAFEAEQLGAQLKEQRRALAAKHRKKEEEVKALKGEDEPAQKKRRATDEGASITSRDEEAIKKAEQEREMLTEELNLCNQQLKDLQNGSCIDLEKRAADLWKNVHTVSYAISTIKSLFELATGGVKTLVEKDFDIKALKEKMSKMGDHEKDQAKTIKALKDQIAAIQNTHREQYRALVKDNDAIIRAMNQKYSTLLSRVSRTGELDSEQLMQFEQLKNYAKMLEESTEQLEARAASVKPPRATRRVSHRIQEIETENVIDGPRNRKSTKMFGDLRDSAKAIDVTIDEDMEKEKSILDTTYKVEKDSSHEKKSRKGSKSKRIMPSDIPSPILPSRSRHSPVPEEDANMDDAGVSGATGMPRRGRQSQLYHRPPSPIGVLHPQQNNLGGIAEDAEENALNGTFVKDDERQPAAPAINSTFVLSNEENVDVKSPSAMEKSILSSSVPPRNARPSLPKF